MYCYDLWCMVLFFFFSLLSSTVSFGTILFSLVPSSISIPMVHRVSHSKWSLVGNTGLSEISTYEFNYAAWLWSDEISREICFNSSVFVAASSH